MSRRWNDHVSEITRQVSAAQALLVMLDFDGTLAPIVPVPAEARMLDAARPVLQELVASPDVRVAILSGRSLADVRQRVSVPGVIYAGNHGMEIGQGGGLEFVEPAAAAARTEIHEIASRIRESISHIDGAEVEDKGLTASVHYRRVAEARRAEVIRAVEDEVSRTGGRLRVTHGRKVVEIRPAVEWNKGAAALWIRSQAGAGALPFFMGDDTTDEDAFAVLQDGITVKIGCEQDTAACYCAASPEEGLTFLRWVASTFRSRTQRG